VKRRHDPELLIRAPELRHLIVLLETLGASEQDLLVECGTDGFEYDGSPSQRAAGRVIDDIRKLRATIHRYRRCRLRALRPRPLNDDDELF
jgi:hypothetical protein